MTDLKLKAGEAVRLCGHRGTMLRAPENTLAALRMAHGQGAAACEIDIRLTADDQLVLLHDAKLERTTNGKGLLIDQSWASISRLDAGSWFAPASSREPVPSFDAALQLASELGLVLRVELKDWHIDDRLFAAIKDVLARHPEPPAVFCSFDHRQLLALRQALPDCSTMGIVHGRPADLVGLARAAQLDGLSVQAPAMADDDIAQIHEAGIAISAFCPMNGPRTGFDAPSLTKLRRWAEMGIIDMITVDDAGMFKSVV